MTLTRNEWREKYGKVDYAADEKQRTIGRLLKKMDEEGKLGKVILDAGAGPLRQPTRTPVLTYNAWAVYYPEEGKKIIRVDTGTHAPSIKEEDYQEKRGETEKIDRITLRMDLNELGEGKMEEKKAVVRAAKFLGLDVKNTEVRPVDTIVLSDILNHANFRAVIGHLGKYLKSGGRIVVHNVEGLAEGDLHEAAPKNNQEIVSHFEAHGYEIEHLTSGRFRDEAYKHEYPNIQNSVGPAMLLVARKRSS